MTAITQDHFTGKILKLENHVPMMFIRKLCNYVLVYRKKDLFTISCVLLKWIIVKYFKFWILGSKEFQVKKIADKGFNFLWLLRTGLGLKENNKFLVRFSQKIIQIYLDYYFQRVFSNCKVIGLVFFFFSKLSVDFSLFEMTPWVQVYLGGNC